MKQSGINFIYISLFEDEYIAILIDSYRTKDKYFLCDDRDGLMEFFKKYIVKGE
jgi:hypothetical protein